MSGRHDILEIIGRPGAAVQVLLGRLVMGIVLTLITGLEPLWRPIWVPILGDPRGHSWERRGTRRKSREMVIRVVKGYRMDANLALKAFGKSRWGRWLLLILVVLGLASDLWWSDGLPGDFKVIDLNKYGGSPEDFRNLLWGITIPLAAVATFMTLIFLARRTRALEDQVRIAEQGQVTDRYARAVELLGHKDPAVRTGAIYALQRVSRDSPSDQPTIMRTIAAYYRKHRPKLVDVAEVDEVRRRASCEIYDFDMLEPDTAAALDVIVSRNAEHDDDRLIDLRDVNFSLLRFEETHFVGINFGESDFRGVALTACVFSNCKSECADFSYSSIESSKFEDSLMPGNIFVQASLIEAIFVNCTMFSSIFCDSNLWASFEECRLWGSDFSHVDGGETRFVNSPLLGVVVLGADFSEANDLDQFEIKSIIYLASDPPSLPEGLVAPPPYNGSSEQLFSDDDPLSTSRPIFEEIE